jgi:hypothetical protein
MTMQNFISRWSERDTPLQEVSPESIKRAETQLGLTFPDDYVSELVGQGIPRISAALAAAMPDAPGWRLFELFHPDYIGGIAIDLRGAFGLPRNVFPIGIYQLGNVLCIGDACRDRQDHECFVMAFNMKHRSLVDVCPTFSVFLEALSNLGGRQIH